MSVQVHYTAYYILYTGKLCSEELEELKGWDIISLPSESEQKNLVPQGETELLGISRRFKQRFPHLYNKQYHNDTFKVLLTPNSVGWHPTHRFFCSEK